MLVKLLKQRMMKQFLMYNFFYLEKKNNDNKFQDQI